jgi:hypothetical protein
MTDVFSRVMKNVKPNMKSLHPYAFVWIRMLMTMAYDAHLLHRLFAIEDHLNTPGSILSLEKLRQLLNIEGSFMGSLSTMVKQEFKFTHQLFSPDEPISLEEPATAEAAFEMSGLRDGMQNKTKRAFLNSPAGIALRRGNHPAAPCTTPGRILSHIPVRSTKGLKATIRRCVICSHHTRDYCKACSTNANGVFFLCLHNTFNEQQ